METGRKRHPTITHTVKPKYLHSFRFFSFSSNNAWYETRETAYVVQVIKVTPANPGKMLQAVMNYTFKFQESAKWFPNHVGVIGSQQICNSGQNTSKVLLQCSNSTTCYNKSKGHNGGRCIQNKVKTNIFYC